MITDLEKIENSINTEGPEKQDVLNQIIAAGLNHMLKADSSGEKTVIDAFATQSFDKILPCWPYLTKTVQFYVFNMHIEKFENFMRKEIKAKK